MTPNSKLIKTGHEGKSLAEILSSPAKVLAGVTESQHKALEMLGIGTVFDLALSPIFKVAHELAAAASDPKHPLARFGLMPAGLVDGKTPGLTPQELLDDSTEQLAGVNAVAAKELLNAAGIATIRDLALWPPYAAARSLSDISPQADDEGQYTAPEIVPKFGEYATDIVYYPKLITISGPDDAAKELDKPIDIMAAPAAGGLKPYLGARLTFQQSWTPEAITLGRLLHSLSLAPGESTKVAVIDWTRKTRTSSEEEVSQSESVSSRSDQNSSLQEVTSAVASEMQEGMSASATTSEAKTQAVAVAAWSPWAAGAGAAARATSESAATSVSASAGRKEMLSDYGQQIDRSTEQASVSARSKRAAMVTETSQSEHEELSTRVVVNYNHMHVLNVLYFEVVQLYRVQLKLDKAERVLFVPMQEFRFDDLVVERFRHILIAAALGPEVRSWLQNRNGCVIGVLQAQSATKINEVLRALDTSPIAKPEAIRRAKEAAKAAGELKALFQSARAIPGAISASNGDDTEWELSGDCKLLHVGWDASKARVEAVEIRTEAGRSIELRTNAGLNAQTVNPAPQLAPGLLAAELESISLKISSADRPVSQKLLLYFITAAGRVFKVPCHLVLPAKQTTVQLLNFNSDLELNQLLRHLNENALYYSQHIWRRLDAQTLGLVLAPFMFKKKRLVEYADTKPIAVNGRHLAFVFPDDDDQEWQKWETSRLSKPYLGNRLVALPTGGVFAEGVLGRSNCAEKIDLTRFWNWQDSPPPIQAPDIAALQAGQHSVESAQRAGGLEAPIVNIMNPQPFPDPSGVGAILGAMGNGNMFRDMSGLAGTQAMVNAGMQSTSALAGQSLNSVVGLTGAVAPLGLMGSAGTGVGAGRQALGAVSNGSPGGAASVAPVIDPATSIARGVERRISPLTSNPTAVGGGINLARELDRSAGGPQRAAGTSSAASLQSNEAGFFRSNFSSEEAFNVGPAEQSGFLVPKGPIPEKGDSGSIRENLPEALRSPTDAGVALNKALRDSPDDSASTAAARINETFLSDLQPLLEQAASNDDKLDQALRLSLDLQAAHELAGLAGDGPLGRAAPALARAWRAALARSVRELADGQLTALKRMERLMAAAQAGFDRPLGLSDAETDLTTQIQGAGLTLSIEAQAQPAEVKAGQQVSVSGVVKLKAGSGQGLAVASARVKAVSLQSLERSAEVVCDTNGAFVLNLTHDPLALGSDANGPRSPDLDFSVALLALHPASDALQADKLVKVPGALSSQLIQAVFDDDGSNALAGTVVVTQPNRQIRLTFQTLSAGVPVRNASVQVSVNGSARVTQATARTGDADSRGLSGVTVLAGPAGSGVSLVALVTTLANGRTVAARADLQGP